MLARSIECYAEVIEKAAPSPHRVPPLVVKCNDRWPPDFVFFDLNLKVNFAVFDSMRFAGVINQVGCPSAWSCLDMVGNLVRKNAFGGARID